MLLLVFGVIAPINNISADATYTRSFSTASKEIQPYDMSFNSDGTKMYIVGNVSDKVHEYALSTGYDISTAIFSKSFPISQDTNPLGLAFSGNGTLMYVAGNTNDRIYQYRLSTDFDISTASLLSFSLYVGSNNVTPQGFAFNSDGTKLFLGDSSIHMYTLSNAYDLSSASFTSTTFVGMADADVIFNSDGSKVYTIRGGANSVQQFTLSTPYNLSTQTSDGELFLTSQDSDIEAIVFNSDGSKFFATGFQNDSVYEYSVSPSFNLMDTTPPTVLSATLDLNTKVLSITFSESVKFALDRSKLFISETGTIDQVPLTGATITTSANGVTISMTITDAQKTSIAAMTSPQLDIQALAATDLAGNKINNAANNAITVTATTPSQVVQSAIPSDGKVLLSWSAPSPGGSAITDYKIFKSTDNILWTLFNDGVSTSTSGVITGLTNNILQYFKVSAVNYNGAGINSTVTSATPIAVSSLVSNVVATGGAKSVSLSWSATDPSITDYTVEYSADGSTWDIYDDDESTSTTATVTGLNATSNYFFRVSPVLTCTESTSASTITTTLLSTPLQITKLTPI